MKTESSNPNENNATEDTMVRIAACSPEQIEMLRNIARSTTAGLWRIKRAKIILGTLEGRSVDKLVLDVRVPPASIIDCRRRFAVEGLSYFEKPGRDPTPREASVERILAFLERSSDPLERGWDTLTHRFVGIWFSARQIKTIRDILASEPGCPVGRLAREVCTRLDLYQPNGKLRLGTVHSILKRMDMDNVITLPSTPRRSHTARAPMRRSLEVPRDMEELASGDIENIRLAPVTTLKEAQLWNEIIYHHHYIKSYRLFGARIRYLVYGSKRNGTKPLAGGLEPQSGSDGRSPDDGSLRETDQAREERLLAVLGFAGSAWRLASRDDYIGWTDDQRVANLRYVVGNARFLILPWIKCPNLASRILGRAVKRLAGDWEERYHYRPVLLETFVQLDRFTGACYKAANWIQLGTTSGYSLYRTRERSQVPRKAVFVYPLTKQFRKVLRGTGNP